MLPSLETKEEVGGPRKVGLKQRDPRDDSLNFFSEI